LHSFYKTRSLTVAERPRDAACVKSLLVFH